MIAGCTGHRPKKLGGIEPYGIETQTRLIDLAKAAFRKFGVTHILSGMALGWDLAAAEAAIDLAIPFTAVIPFEGQDQRWPKASRARYADLCEKAKDVVIIGEKAYLARAMQDRNIWIVDNCAIIFALYNGSSGGTANFLSYAKQIDRKTINLWASWQKYR